jgi:transcriptional regulator with XRE-family HTH domain
MRTERGFSLRALSRAATLDVGYLSKVENGRRTPTVGVAKAVDRALQTKGELVALARLERSKRIQQALPFDPMRRRSLLALGLGVPTLAGSEPAGEPRRRKLGIADAKELEDTAVWLYGLDYQHGGATLWRAARASACDGYNMLEDGAYSDVVGKRLLNATGRIQMCTGWLAFDSGRHELARSCYTEALALARQAGDAEVEVHALSNLAFQSNVLGRPREAMRFIEGALRADSAPHGRARLSAIPQLRRSVALSLSQDRSGHGKAMAAARRVLDRDYDKPAEEWCAFLGAAELDGVEGTGLLELGQPRRAQVLLERAVAGHGGRYARNRALYRVRLARARLHAKLVDGAAEAAIYALEDLASQVASLRVENELSFVATKLAEFSHEESVNKFMMQYASFLEKKSLTKTPR